MALTMGEDVRVRDDTKVVNRWKAKKDRVSSSMTNRDCSYITNAKTRGWLGSEVVCALSGIDII